MSDINRVSLFGKLNSLGYKAIESATVFCKLRGNPYVELVHWFNQLLQLPDSDLHRIVREFQIEPSRLARDMTAALDRLPRGATSISDLSSHISEAVERGWVFGTLLFGESQVRTGHLVVGILQTPGLRNTLVSMSAEFDKIKIEQLTERFAQIVAASPENAMQANDGFQTGGGAEPGEASGAIAPAAMGKQEALKKYSVDLTERAKDKKIDTVLGRDFEIRQMVDILTRRRQNNPILTGEAGVGKTAVVEGFAQRIADRDVPPSLQNVTVRTLDLALLQAGAGIKGEFENRLKSLVEEVKRSPTPIILFIDEAHTMIGAGGAAGQSDAANILKPALARGELRTIAATTWSEYKKYFEKDPALARRFQVVKVEEPSEEQCLVMMRGITGSLEKHHNVRILDEGVGAAVKLSHRFIAGRQLPDKAVSVLDTACARLALGQNSTPAAIEDAVRQLDDLEVQERVLNRETAVGVDHSERLETIGKQKAAVQGTLTAMRERWTKEKELVTKIREIRKKLEGDTPGEAAPTAGGNGSAGVPAAPVAAAPTAPDAKPEELRKQLQELESQLSKLQGEAGLIRVCVDAHIVGEVISGWTGIPVGKMMKDEIATILQLQKLLGNRVIGQPYALEIISQRIETSRASLDDPNKPVGVFMLVGPSGVGKTETALALSDQLYGGEHNLITINMSEFQESHTVSTLKGSPPGYVGYGEGGVLTEAVRRRPYSVVLLDEVEKAHPDVLELFFQVFDKGNMEDGEGRSIDFKNNIIILTTNACTDQMMKLCADPETAPSPQGLVMALKPELNKIFKPAFLGRMVVVPYYPIRDEALKRIIVLKLNKIQRRVQENHKISLTYDDKLIEEVAKRCTEVESGARNVDNILTNSLLPDISRQILGRMAEGAKLNSIHVGIGADGAFSYQ